MIRDVHDSRPRGVVDGPGRALGQRNGLAARVRLGRGRRRRVGVGGIKTGAHCIEGECQVRRHALIGDRGVVGGGPGGSAEIEEFGVG